MLMSSAESQKGVKGKDQFWKHPLSKKNDLEALINNLNHVKEYVLTNT